jgi:serine protease Do
MGGAASTLQDAGKAVLAAVGPTVVRIGRDGGRGCGVVVGDGLVLTNAHNLRDHTTQVTFDDGRTAQGQVAGADLDGDLAVLEVDTGGVTAVAWADTGPSTGDVAFSVAASSSGDPRVTFGMVSGVDRAFRGPRGRRITGSVEHTVPLARGSSGSPLVDADGRLLGINTNRIGDGFYLAVPTSPALRERVDALARGESPTRVRLGVGLAPAHVARRLRRAVGLPERNGLLVRVVEEGSPAARGGVQAGDLIVSAGGTDVSTVDQLFETLDGVAPGSSLLLHVVRGADELDISVRFDDEGGATTEGEA